MVVHKLRLLSLSIAAVFFFCAFLPLSARGEGAALLLSSPDGAATPIPTLAGRVLATSGPAAPQPTVAIPIVTPTPVPPPPTPVPPQPTAAPTLRPAAPQPTAQPAPAAAPAAALPPLPAIPRDERFFEQTGFRVANDQFWNFFNRRGGPRTFGYPISREFLMFGFRVQFFQRTIMQLNQDGSVATMNLLDEGLMPYTRINFSTFPAPDAKMAGDVPKPGSDGYMDKLLDYIEDKSPDKWNDLQTIFYKTFANTVRYEDAYPDGKQDPGIMPAINLEMWGVPTSAPSYDPTNKNFVYLRFQRGIMHFDKTTGATQGLLLGDYLKSIITGVNLPPDLEEQAKSSRFYRQYNSTAANGLSRPNDMPGTDMRGAFARDGLVVIDAGHGGSEIGTAKGFADAPPLLEKNVNLKVALKTADILRASGRQVLLTRATDTQVNNPPKDLTGNGKATLDDDLEARIDLANSAGASVFVSIHFNGSSNTDLQGAEVYYNGKRPFTDQNKKLAQTVLDNLVGSTKAAGYNLANRGIKNDEQSVGKGNSFYLLGPVDEDKPRASQMVGVLGEAAFFTNDQDLAMVRQDKFLDAVAAGYAQGIQQYLQSVGK